MTDSFDAIPIADRLEIEALLARQSHLVDESDAEAWADTFTTDGVFESPTYQLVARGPVELAEFARTSNDRARSQGRQFRHVVSSIWLTAETPDRIRSRQYVMIHITDAEGTRVDRSLVVSDLLLRTQNGWRVQHRTMRRDGIPQG